jgi:hypothetical protein
MGNFQPAFAMFLKYARILHSRCNFTCSRRLRLEGEKKRKKSFECWTCKDGHEVISSQKELDFSSFIIN